MSHILAHVRLNAMLRKYVDEKNINVTEYGVLISFLTWLVQEIAREERHELYEKLVEKERQDA